jgi:integrase
MLQGNVQRWLCRNCGLRFSDLQDVQKAWSAFEHIERIDAKSLKRGGDKVTTRQICVTETKNLATEQKTIEVPCRKEVDLKGAIVEFLWQLKKENRSEDTIKAYGYALKTLVNIGVNLYDPQSFLEKMPTQTQWSEIRKYNITKAYRCFLNEHKINASLPKYKVTRPLPYIPVEEFLDQLIASCNQQMATFLQTLKETGARPGEAWKLEWDDLDIEGKKLHISHPEKGCNPRIRPISAKLLRMLLALPRTKERIFTYKSRDIASKTFRAMRKRAIQKLSNPELRKIDFYTFRYWRATTEYRRYHDFGCVMVLLGHKSLRYVLLYAQLSDAYVSNEAYVCKEAHTRQEAKQLIEDGFEYVMDKEGISLFRKIK